MILYIVPGMRTGTVGTAEEDIIGFHAMTNDLTTTVGAFGGKRVDGTFETIEDMGFTIRAHLKTFIVFVSAHLTHADVAIASEQIRDQAFGCFYRDLLLN